MIVREALDWAATSLEDTSEARLAASMLLAHILACSTTDLFVHPERTLNIDEEKSYRQIVARRAQHEPVAYLIGHRAFFGLDLGADRRALIPRPETELLVEQALHVARRWQCPRIADVGSGSGAIAICLSMNSGRIIHSGGLNTESTVTLMYSSLTAIFQSLSHVSASFSEKRAISLAERS